VYQTGEYAKKPCGLEKAERIRKGKEFKAVFSNGKRLKFSSFSICFAKNRYGFCRIGLSASKKIGGAVKRNRAKRRIRELFRLSKYRLNRLNCGYDIVFILKRTCAEKDWEELRAEFDKLVKRFEG
jgi:ribonuclease P protein component